MRIEHDSDDDDDSSNSDDDNVRMVSLCRQHSLEKMSHANLRFSSPDVLSGVTLTVFV